MIFRWQFGLAYQKVQKIWENMGFSRFAYHYWGQKENLNADIDMEENEESWA